ncbi:MAG: protein translocase subunit SecF [Candidatus Paceibacterota bacterium]
MYIARHKNIFLSITGGLALIAIFAIIFFGLQLGIEFTGGTSVGVSVEEESVTKLLIEETVQSELPGSLISVQRFGDSGFTIKTPTLEEGQRELVVNALEDIEGVSVSQSSFVGPTIGSELQRKSLIAVTIVVISIVLFVAFAFRHISKPISSWTFGAATIGALVFDLLIATGAFAVFGVLFGAEVDSLFIIALLTVLGYSVNDTIIVFDRVRERLSLMQEQKKNIPFEKIMGESINQTLTRSINTSLTTSLALLALYIFGGEPTRIFSLTLLVGVLSGTYSSIFFASPLLLFFEERTRKSKK